MVCESGCYFLLLIVGELIQTARGYFNYHVLS
jgi:hypothetical protein